MPRGVALNQNGCGMQNGRGGGSGGPIWIYLLSLGLTWSHLNLFHPIGDESFGLTWFRLDVSGGFAWDTLSGLVLLASACLLGLRLTWLHLASNWFRLYSQATISDLKRDTNNY